MFAIPTRTRAAAAGLAVVALAFLVGCSDGGGPKPSAAKAEAPDRKVTVTATGSSEGVPDAMLVNISVVTGGDSAAEVLADNNNRTQKVLDQLKITAVDDKDVSTTSIDLGPTYDDDGNITGYLATNSLRIRFRSLESAGAKLDALVQGGDDHVRIEGVQLGFADDDELVGTARVDAVERARAQAEQMAEAGGAKVGDVRTITELEPTDFYATEERASYDGAASAVPVAPGSQELNITVKVVFDLA